VALFGRGPQGDMLDALIDGIRGTGGRTVLVLGAPGIGKSALLAHAVTHASAAGFTIVRLFGEPARSDVPYAGLQQLAHSLGGNPDALAEPQRSALAMALGTGEATVPDVFLVGLATLNLVAEAAARAPVLLVADDIQWLDDPTLSLLAFMGRRVQKEPVLLLGAAREGYRGRLSADELTTLTLPPAVGRRCRIAPVRHSPRSSPFGPSPSAVRSRGQSPCTDRVAHGRDVGPGRSRWPAAVDRAA